MSSVFQSLSRFAYDHYLTIELVLLVLFLISLALKFRWKSAYNKLLSEREEDRLKAQDEISRANRFIDHKKAEAKRSFPV